MLKRLLLLGLVAGILSAVASLVYQQVYAKSLGPDFATVVKPVGVFVSCIIGSLLASVGFWLLTRWMKGAGEIIFNFLFAILSFASIVGVFAFKLPVNMDTPELFPGLTIPMHFFPALAWFTLRPLFVKQGTTAKQG